MIFLSFILCMLGFIVLSRIAQPKINSINNITINVYFYYGVLSLVGAFIIASHHESYDLVSNFIEQDVKENALLVISANFFVYCISVCFFLFVFKCANGNLLQAFKKQSVTIPKNEKNLDLFFVILLMLCIFALLYLLFIDGTAPLALLIRGGDLSQVYDARIESFDKNILAFLLKKVLTEASIITALYFFLRPGLLRKTVACVCCLSYGFLQTEKAPFVYFILALIFLITLKNKKNIGLTKVLLIFSGLVSILVLLYSFLYQQSSFADSLNNVINRVFIQQISGVFLSIQYYGSHAPFDMGYNLFPRIYSLLGFSDNKIIAEQLAEHYLHNLYVTGSVKNINGLYIMDAWASGGWIGTILVTIVLAGYSAFIYSYFLHKRKEPLVLAFYSYFAIYNFSFITNAGVALFSPFALLFLLMFSFLYKRK